MFLIHSKVQFPEDRNREVAHHFLNAAVPLSSVLHGRRQSEAELQPRLQQRQPGTAHSSAATTWTPDSVRGKPAYVIMYGDACFNSKRQARRTVDLYAKYRGRVQFVIIGIDRPLPPAQQELKKKYFVGYIPHVEVLDASGVAIYHSSGEVAETAVRRCTRQGPALSCSLRLATRLQSSR